MLVKCYGQYWNPDVVNWSGGIGGDGFLHGDIRRDRVKYKIDFWKARGIYVLYSDFKAVYVGKAYKTSIGKRLRDHLTDRMAGRWDMFSWYSVSSPRITQGDVSQPGQRQLTPETVIGTLEALAILIADPALNRKRESFTDAYEATQSGLVMPRTIRSYLQEILTNVDGPAK